MTSASDLPARPRVRGTDCFSLADEPRPYGEFLYGLSRFRRNRNRRAWGSQAECVGCDQVPDLGQQHLGAGRLGGSAAFSRATKRDIAFTTQNITNAMMTNWM